LNILLNTTLSLHVKTTIKGIQYRINIER